MSVIINLLPNVYWIYNNPSRQISPGEYSIEVRKQCEYMNIKTIIELDEKLAFWNKSRQYINDIKIEMEKNEFANLLAILKKLNDIIKNAYTSNNPLFISTYKKEYLELGLAVWIYFFHINANIQFDIIIKLLGFKIIGQITMSDELKKFFAFINLQQIGNSRIS
jgi:hypothetical protein